MVDVSVIIPTRNRLSLLKRAIDSVKNQTSNLAIELIVVDDGDPYLSDEVFSLVEKSGGKYFFTGGKKGGSIARNIGIENSNGKYIAFLDDDDEWHKEKLITQLEIITKNHTEMCYTAIIVKNKKGKCEYIFHKPSSKDQYKAIMKKNFIGSTSSVIIKKEILEKVGSFDPSLPALQDYDLYIRILKHFHTTWTEKPLTIYYIDSTDKVSENRENYLRAKKILLEKYSKDPFYSYLKRSLNYIFFLKCFRSKKFLVDTIKGLIHKR